MCQCCISYYTVLYIEVWSFVYTKIGFYFEQRFTIQMSSKLNRFVNKMLEINV